MHGRIPRLVLVTPIVAVLALTVMASRTAALGGAETPALKSISSRLDGAVSTVLIEASEPVAYLTSQPDPLTVLVDLRNVNVAGLDGKPRRSARAGNAVGVERAIAPDGAPVARVRLRLDRAARHRVRSSRNTILVELIAAERRRPGRRAGRGADVRAGAARGEARGEPRPQAAGSREASRRDRASQRAIRED